MPPDDGEAPWEDAVFDPMSLHEAEFASRWLLRKMWEAKGLLEKARDAEVDANAALKDARRRAWYDQRCPKPERGGYTVADREMFVENEVQALELTAELAKPAARPPRIWSGRWPTRAWS